jgi:DNA-binding response OmpR family regulator
MVKKILIVDDDEYIRITTRQILEKKGYKVYTAIDGEDGLKKYSKERPDLILLDIMMPGTPVREIIPQMKKTKIAFFSVVKMSDAEKEKIFVKDNCVDYIQKPFDIEDLLRRVKKILDSK